MHTLDQQLIASALGWLGQGKTVWLCTVLHTFGSAPRPAGAMLAASAAGEFCGSLSGGCIEEDFLQRLAQFSAASQIVRYGGDGLATAVNLPCGGVLDVLVERLPADSQSLAHLHSLSDALNGGSRILKQLTIGQPAQLESCSADALLPPLHYDPQSARLPVGCVPVLLLAGYSAVAASCIPLALMLGFRVLVCEHRAEQWRQLMAQQPEADNLQRIAQHPARYLEQQGASAGTAIISLTHDPRIDDLTMMEAVQTPAFYLGAMGSAKNSQQRRERLRRIGELDEASLARIYAPIGLPIGSKTPAEIALAIMADIVRVRNQA